MEPKRLWVQQIQSHLDTKSVGRVLKLFDRVSSTNDLAKQDALHGAVDGTVYLAEQQTAGRGRRGHTWVSEPGSGIFLSVLLRPTLTPQDVLPLTLMTGFAVCGTLQRVCHIEPSIKWPNDILLQGKKLCGILAEMSTTEHAIRYVVMGIGLNVSNQQFPAELQGLATSLQLETGRDWDRGELIGAILTDWEKAYLDFLQPGGRERMLVAYRSCCSTLGKPIAVLQGDRSFSAVAQDIAPDGALLVQEESGKIRPLQAGEVSIRLTNSEKSGPTISPPDANSVSINTNYPDRG